MNQLEGTVAYIPLGALLGTVDVTVNGVPVEADSISVVKSNGAGGYDALALDAVFVVVQDLPEPPA